MKINRWFQSAERKQIVKELFYLQKKVSMKVGGNVELRSELLKKTDPKEFDRIGTELKERMLFLVDVLARGDRGEPVDEYFSDGHIKHNQTKRGRKSKNWSEIDRITKLYLKEHKHLVSDESGKVQIKTLAEVVSSACQKNGITVETKTLKNRFYDSNLPADIKKLLK